MSTLRYKSPIENNPKAVYFTERATGYFASSDVDHIVPISKVIHAKVVALSEAEKTNIVKTQESAAELDALKANVEKILAIVPLAETATEEEKIARELKVKKDREEVVAQFKKLAANVSYSGSAKFYHAKAQELVNKMNNVTPVDAKPVEDITHMDRPVLNKLEVRMSNKDTFTLEFTCTKAYDSFISRIGY